MELYQIRQFLAVAETGGFTKGASRIAVSQPALSAGIAKLEAEFGTKLFQRDRRRVVLTSAGLRFLETARLVIDACNKTKAEIKESEDARPTLRLGILSTLSIRRLSRLFHDFRAGNPDIDLEILDGSEADLEHHLGRDRVDMALTILRAERARTNPYSQKKLFSERYLLAVPKNHRLAQRRSIRLADLDGEAFVLRTHCEYRKATQDLTSAQGIRVRVTFRTDQDDRALALVSAGVGVAMLPELYDATGVARVPISDYHMKRTIGLKWMSRSNEEAVDRFLKFAPSHDWTSDATA